MKKIHHLFFEDIIINDIYHLIDLIIKKLPKELYVTNKINYYNNNRNSKKITIGLDCMNNSDIIFIKILKSSEKVIPEELIYLSTYYENHYFYQDCFLAYSFYKDYIITVVKSKKADGDITDFKFNISTYNKLNEMITDELYKMHSNEIIHMDIKTTNILYKKTSDGIKFGLCDFELVNNNNSVIGNIFKRYYFKLYKFNKFPDIYNTDCDIFIFNKMLQLLRNNKKIKLNSI